MNKKGLAILMRARMKSPRDQTKLPLLTLNNRVNQIISDSQDSQFDASVSEGGANKLNVSTNGKRDFDSVRESLHSAISLNKTEVLDVALNDFSEGYVSLSFEDRQKLLLTLAKVYDLNRMQVRDLIKQYLGFEVPGSNSVESSTAEEEAMLSCFYRIERNLRQALQPAYEVLFERLNNHPGGLKFLSIFRADILSFLA
ncbi:hypothetical protein JCGZ_21175 [Jatropha curcas]|uniref:Malonyl-CoA decarboxylase N-terminal domain-containing protein n=2 Tax=Jatropha curcas TaxID=180498 RepID=A0A067JMJ7_JATCU|nr:hypothetical protein JCGZ_21175 [Jatropha curcas]